MDQEPKCVNCGGLVRGSRVFCCEQCEYDHYGCVESTPETYQTKRQDPTQETRPTKDHPSPALSVSTVAAAYVLADLLDVLPGSCGGG